MKENVNTFAVMSFGEWVKETTRKEVAKEILHMLYMQGISKEITEVCAIYDINGVALAKKICKKYGVEVEG